MSTVQMLSTSNAGRKNHANECRNEVNSEKKWNVYRYRRLPQERAPPVNGDNSLDIDQRNDWDKIEWIEVKDCVFQNSKINKVENDRK